MLRAAIAAAFALSLSLVVAACGDDGGDNVVNGNGGSGGSGGTTTGGDGDGDGDDGGDTPPTEPGWATQPSVPGGPIQETAAVALDGKVYILGGFNEDAVVVDHVRVFDTASGEWTLAAPLPREAHHVNAVVADGKIFVTGALETRSFTPTGDVWVYDPATDEWDTSRTPMTAGEERGSSFVGAIDGTIYVAGGLVGPVAQAAFSSYDIANDEWNDELPNLPEIRDHGAFGVIDGVLYAVGGRRGGIATVENTVFIFDPAVGEWRTGEPMPTARGGVAAAVVGDLLVVAGGEGSNQDPGGVFPQVEAYRPADNTWLTLDPMPTPRHGMGAAGVGNVFYTPGGATSQAFGAVDTHEALVIE